MRRHFFKYQFVDCFARWATLPNYSIAKKMINDIAKIADSTESMATFYRNVLSYIDYRLNENKK